MRQDIANGFSLVESTHQLWEAIVERFSQSSAPYCFNKKRELVNLDEGDLSVPEYFNKMKKKWNESQDLEVIPMCTRGKMSEWNVEMSTISVKKGRKFQGENSNPKRDFYKEKLEKMKLICEYCGKRGHNVKTGCFDLIGYPDWYKKGKIKVAANVEKEEESESPLEIEEDEEMQLNPRLVKAAAKQMAKMMSKASGNNKGD
ncbi:Thymidine kinase, partial [Bienertia sinuspersici]